MSEFRLTLHISIGSRRRECRAKGLWFGWMGGGSRPLRFINSTYSLYVLVSAIFIEDKFGSIEKNLNSEITQGDDPGNYR